jgi:hypothetical protein
MITTHDQEAEPRGDRSQVVGEGAHSPTFHQKLGNVKSP